MNEGARRALRRLGERAVQPARRMAESERAIDAYALVHAASVAGDALLALSLANSVFFSLPVDQAKTKVALYLLLTMAPLAVAAPLLAKVLDRGGFRRALTATAAVVRALLALLMASRTETLLLFPLAFGALVASRVHLVSKNALTASYAEEEEGLVAANALLSRVAAVTAVVVLAPGLAVGRIGGPGAVLFLAAVAYAGCALLVLRLPRAAEDPVAEVPEGTNLVPGPVRVAAIGMAGVRAGGGFLIFLVAFTVRRVDQPAYWLGLVLGAVALGTLLGAVVAPRMARARSEQGLVLAALGVAAVGSAAVATEFSLATLTLYALVAGLAGEVARLAFQSLMQREVGRGAEGRAFVRFEVAFQLAWVGGAFVPALVSVTFRQGLLLMALLYGGAAALNAVTRRRHAA
ncbi:MAG TPA: MFS transporter [Actinomycetota bacterium]|nr:MFS transporter [Actinomycetota bacterium]